MARVCDAICKTRNHYASHNDYSSWSTPFGVATFQPPPAVGFSFSKKVPFGFEVSTCQKVDRTQMRFLKLIVLSLGLIQAVNEAKNKFKKIIKIFISIHNGISYIK